MIPLPEESGDDKWVQQRFINQESHGNNYLEQEFKNSVHGHITWSEIVELNDPGCSGYQNFTWP